jgi:hypothetical protein
LYMADNILRLRVDSTEYDSKIKRAAEGIQQYAQKCREAGGTLSFLDDGVLEFVQSLGQMDTVAKGSRQQMREMSNALTTLTMTYRGLTEEEKASPFGVELARGIDALTERAGEARDAMSDVEQSIRNASSDTRTFDQLAQGMSVATAGFQGLTGAGKLLGIEMGNDVEVIAKLQAAMAVTNSLTTIQTALQKQSALMQGLNAAKTSLEVVAQQAYAVATGEATVAQAAFNVAANANPYMLIITVAAAAAAAIYAYCEATDDAEEKQEALNVQLENARTQMEGIKTDSDFNVAIAKAAGESENAIRKMRLEAARARLALADMTLDQVTASGSGATKEQIKQAQEASQAAWREVKKVLDEMTVAEVERLTKLKTGPEVVITPDHKTTTTTKSLKEEKDDFVEINGLIAQAEEHISNLQQRIKEAPDETTISTLKHQLVEAQDELKRLNNIGSEVSNADLPPLGQMEAVLKKLNEDLKNAETPEAYQNLLADIKAINEEIDTFTGRKRDKKDKKKDDKSFEKEYSKIVGGVSSIASGIQQMGIEMPKELQNILGVLTGISSIMSGITALLTLIQIDTKATAVSTTADAIMPFANGGIVMAAGGTLVGNSFSGDNLRGIDPSGQIYGLNAGEVVLNRAQVGVLANELTRGESSEGYSPSYVSGEQIYITLNRYLRRTGRGELMGWKKNK